MYVLEMKQTNAKTNLKMFKGWWYNVIELHTISSSSRPDQGRVYKYKNRVIVNYRKIFECPALFIFCHSLPNFYKFIHTLWGLSQIFLLSSCFFRMTLMLFFYKANLQQQQQLISQKKKIAHLNHPFALGEKWAGLPRLLLVWCCADIPSSACAGCCGWRCSNVRN